MKKANFSGARAVRQASLCLLFIFTVTLVQAGMANPQEWLQGLSGSESWRQHESGLQSSSESRALITEQFYADSIVKLRFQFLDSGPAKILFLGRYALHLDKLVENSEEKTWHDLELWFRSPRLNDALEKLDSAAVLKIVQNGELQQRNIIIPQIDKDSTFNYERPHGQHYLLPQKSQLKIGYFQVERADFSAVELLDNNKTNIDALVDFVARGKQDFKNFGCIECHSVMPGDTAVKSGPNLYGLFQRDPREIEIIEGGEQHRFRIKADMQYLLSSLRTPRNQIAIGRSEVNKGKVFQPVMPPYNESAIDSSQVYAIGDYLQTLNTGYERGPVVKLLPEAGPGEYQPLEDPFLFLAAERTRVQRGPMQGMSARSIHIGVPGGINYSFDPRNLSIVKIWQGGFLDMSGEFSHRGGRGMEPGFNASEIQFGDKDFLLAPLTEKGKRIDFAFKEAKFRDHETMLRSLNAEREHLELLADIDAQFLGYHIDSRDPRALPQFSYRVGANTIHLAFSLDQQGQAALVLSGDFKEEQAFQINPSVLMDIEVSAGVIKSDRWILPEGSEAAKLNARIPVSSQAWASEQNNFAFLQQRLEKTLDNNAALPAGYALENLTPPKDNFGREQLFEPLGLAQAKDGTIVVATRTAGIWRIKDKQWHYFAEGTFESLGLVIEDDKGLVLTVGQKPELTRIADTNGDGIADHYKTLFDQFSYHGNYHSYMHGPIKTRDGKYYITLNLLQDDEAYRANAKYMGTFGGYRGWAFLVGEDGDFAALASGLRSPAGLGMSPDGRLWFTDNQGEYLGTSKLFLMQKGAFYGYPASLVDKPGMQPDSKAITWDKVKNKRAQATLLFPHNYLANSPGNIVWNDTNGKFGPFEGQAFLGDQTLSTLMRMQLEKVGDTEQGALIPFAANLASGVMRPLFLQDGSLLMGQTGRGWRARGGEVTSLQRMVWDGKTLPAEIASVTVQPRGFLLEFTQTINDLDKNLVSISSWRYRDAADYGSPELDRREEKIENLEVLNEGRALLVELEPQKETQVHPEQSSRIYHISVDRKAAFNEDESRALEVFYTLNAWPNKPVRSSTQ